MTGGYAVRLATRRDGCNRGRRRTPTNRRSQVLRAAVAESAHSGKRLGGSDRYRRVWWVHLYGHQAGHHDQIGRARILAQSRGDGRISNGNGRCLSASIEGGNRGIRRAPGRGGSQIVGCAVAIASYGVELLGKPSRYRRADRSESNRLECRFADPRAERIVDLLDLLGAQGLVEDCNLVHRTGER